VREPKCASRQKTSKSVGVVFVICSQVIETLQQNLPRYDESASGRFVGGFNTYGYVYGNPTGLIDRDGKIPGLVGAAAGAAVNFGLQFGSNLIGNGYNVEDALRCVDFKKVGTAALLGFFLPGAFATGRSFGTNQFASNLGQFALIGVPTKFGLDGLLPDWRPFDKANPSPTYDRTPPTIPGLLRNLF
jgi:hypothetical protein